MYHKHTTHTTSREKKFDKKRPPLGGFRGFPIYSTVKDPTKYVYKIIASASSTGRSTLSKSVTTYRVARPAVSTLTNSGAKKMTVKWGKNAKATGYQIQYSTDKTFKTGTKSVTISSASTVAKAITGLAKGITYYVRIRTFKTAGSTKYFSAWSAVKSVKITK